MPHATMSDFDHIQIKELAPTFGAEVLGVDFSKPVPPEVFAEVHRAITQVRTCVCSVPLLVFHPIDHQASMRHVPLATLSSQSLPRSITDQISTASSSSDMPPLMMLGT